MKITLLILAFVFCGFTMNAARTDSPNNSNHLNAEKGTAIGLGKSKSQAASKARRNIPKGARQYGAVKYVKNGDGTYTAYIDWKK